MDAPLVGHAHHHCHILIKAGGADGAFSVRGERAPLTDDSAVLVNAWEHHAYEHPAAPGQRTLILALYIEPGWLADLQRSLALSGHPRFFPQSCVRISPATRKITEEFVLELWWADEVSPARLEDLLRPASPGGAANLSVRGRSARATPGLQAWPRPRARAR